MRRLIRIHLLLFLSVFSHYTIGVAEEISTRTDEVRETLQQALQAATVVQNPFFRARIIDGIVSAYVAVGGYERALELAGMKDNVSRDGTLWTISRALVEQGQAHRAKEIISQMADGYLKASALEELAQYNIARGEHAAVKDQLSQALKATEGISDSYSKTNMMLRVAEAQFAEGHRVSAQATLRRVMELSLGVQDIDTRDLVVGQAAKSQALFGDEKEALRILDQVQNADRRESGLRNIVSVVAKRGDIAYAMELATSIKGESNHEFALQGIAVAQVEAGDFDGALKTASSIHRGRNSKVIALGRIADEMRERGDRIRSLPVLRQAAEAATQISDVRERARYLGGIARRQAEANDRPGAKESIREALRILNAHHFEEELDGALLVIAQAQGQLGEIADALKSAAMMSSDFYQDRAYFQIAKAQAWAGDIQGALQTAALSHGYDFMWRGYTLQRIAKIQAHKGNKESALAWAMAQAAPSDRALALLGVAEGLLSQGRSINNYPNSFDF